MASSMTQTGRVGLSARSAGESGGGLPASEPAAAHHMEQARKAGEAAQAAREQAERLRNGGR